MRPRPFSGLCRAAAGCLLFLAVPVLARAQAKSKDDPRETPEVRKLVFHGVQSVDQVDLEKSIATDATACRNILLTPICLVSRSPYFVTRKYLDRKELATDVLRIRVYYWKHGFRNAEVDTTVTSIGPEQVQVTFDVREGPATRVRRLAIQYDSTLLSDRRVNKLVLLKAGDPLDLVKLDSMRILYANELWSQGHGDAHVDTAIVVDTARKIADVRLQLVPEHATFVGPIVIRGLDRVKETTVLNSITFHTGDAFRQNDMLESQRNLFESGLFRLAAIEVPPQLDSVKTVTIALNESPLHSSHVGVGLTNTEFLQTQATYTAFNFFGGARRLDINGTVEKILATQLAGHGFFHNPGADIPGADAGKYLQPTWSASIEFRQPAFLRRPANQAGFSGFAHRRSTPGIFIDRGFGGTATFTRQVRIRAPASLTYRYEVNRVDAGDAYFCVNYGVCDTLTIASLRSHQTLSPLALTGFIDRSDDPLDPTRGYVARIDLEHASGLTMSDYRYNRGYFDAAAYDHRGRQVFSAHLRLGAVHAFSGPDGDAVLHPRKRLYAGGASSVRGYGENQLGPRILAVDPAILTDPARPSACTLASIRDRSCDPDARNEAGTVFRDGDFIPQPLGGTSVAEGSVEYRFPLPLHRKLSGAVFVDGGVVGESQLQTLSDVKNITLGTWAVTPGFGIRYKSPVGPIRVDVGINPRQTEQLAVVTEVLIDGERKIVPLAHPRTYSPAGKTLLDRLTLHFSIGQPY